MTNSCLNDFESILGSSCYTLSLDSPQSSRSTSPLSFWAFINKTPHFRPFGYFYCYYSLNLGLGRFGSHFFKEGAPLAPGPTFRSWVES